METHLSVFLTGASREIRRIMAGAADLDERTARTSLERVSIALTHLAVSWKELPALMSPLSTRQRGLLDDTIAVMSRLKLELPGEALSVRQGSGGRDADLVYTYDQLKAAQAACLRSIVDSGNDHSLPSIKELLRRATEIESEAHALYVASLDQLVQSELDAPPDTDEALRAAPAAAELRDYLRARFPDATSIAVSGVKQLRGANSKDIIFFDVAGVLGWPNSVVMRRLRSFSVNTKASMPYEFELLSHLKSAGLSVPRPLLVEASAKALGQPFMLMERLTGAARSVSELGAHAPKIILQLAGHLARIHQTAPAPSVSRRQPRQSVSERLLPFLQEYYHKWSASQVEPSATIEHLFSWLRSNVSRVDEALVLVHGDYDLRNVLVEEDRITAVLDWERSHLGHPAEDLAYCFYDVTRVMEWERFLATYYECGGPKVSTDAIEYFLIWTGMTRVVGASQVKATFQRGLHRDFTLGAFGIIEFNEFYERVVSLLLAADRQLDGQPG